MGTSTAGIAFRPKTPMQDMTTFLNRLFGEPASPIPPPQNKYLDIRPPENVVVANHGDAWFVLNADLILDILRHPEKDVRELAERLGMPDLIIAFCQFDSGDSCGYAFIENGVLTRSRLQTFDSVAETGQAKQFESDWLNAKHFIEEDPGALPEELQKIYYRDDRQLRVPEHNLTSTLLQEALELNFGICPWEADRQPDYQFFKLVQQKTSWKRWLPKFASAR